MYAFSNGERALRRAASYVELGRVWFERERKRGGREERVRGTSHQEDGFVLCANTAFFANLA